MCLNIKICQKMAIYFQKIKVLYKKFILVFLISKLQKFATLKKTLVMILVQVYWVWVNQIYIELPKLIPKLP